MSSSNDEYNKNGVYPLSLYLSSLTSHQEIISNNPYNQLIASPGQMASAVPDSLLNYMAFHSNNSVNQQQGFGFPEVSGEIKKPVKKDRHSKIHTAQGLRDRRVRLSIGIARQFFDLQDMLGFDKASKTLDWLLKKSNKAIKEVVREKKLNNHDVKDFGSLGDYVEEEEDEDGDDVDDVDDDDDDGNKSFVYGSSHEKCEDEMICEVKKVEKSKLSKARGKAKESTREMAYDHQDTISEITQSEILDPFKRSIFFNEGEDMTHSFYKEPIEEFDNQDSILTKRKINPSTNMGQTYYQHNGTFMLKAQSSSSNYNIMLPQNLGFDHDQNPFVDQLFAVTNTNFPRGFP